MADSSDNLSRLCAKIDYLSPKLGCRPVLENAALMFEGGKITWLLGPSGAGKTTLLRLLGGDQLVEFRGNIEYHTQSRVMNLAVAEKLGHIGLFLPTGGLPPWQRVNKILLLPSRLNPKIGKPTNEQIHLVLSRMRLSLDTLAKFPSELSLGMRYRILLAYVFLYKPIYCFIDEIFSAIDQPTATILLNELQYYIQETRGICVLATHDIDRALEFTGNYIYKDLFHGILPLSAPTKLEVIELFERDLNTFLPKEA